ncbi:SulP family inorganic anion transporter [Desulforamulus hydrothermalis]|uniref:Sulphate transporter n=1 Tax=Desulforamulus hydrothermalis Lam5 = DSM 18033 TaxID=1121428 RepID=K8ELW3_9FIRM|nr:SulP family inorganic anion transporter [Desulforamulus hydrothermalis]CCO09461.1 Sulphate transporter [Desulforamulus hydrothermalis Lam5 = DSM 18033]SHH07706.1 sulfate permease, SulP family [Desulforamulus hydrothermalis Lam5 = DSM 18033]
MNILKFVPILDTLKSYDKKDFKFDLVAALTVAVVALPQTMAYAMIAGVHPAYGLYAGIVLTIVASSFGSSHQLATGPTNAISLLIAAYMVPFAGQDNFFANLFLLTFLVGAIQFLMGVLRLGSLVNYVSHAVIVGFTAGAGIIIAMGQLNNLMGIKLPKGHLSSIDKVIICLQNIDKLNYVAFGLGIFTIAVIVICKKINKNLPGALLGVIFSVVLVMTLNLEKYGVKIVGQIPQAIPPLSQPNFSPKAIADLSAGALVIAIIGLVEAVSISKAIAAKTLQKIDPNQEFIGQGLANMVGGFFSCIAGSGSFTRSAITYQNGGRTRLAGVLVGVIMLLVLIFFAPYAKYIPNASLAGVIMVVAYSMIDKKALVKVLKTNRNDAAVLLVTMLTTIFAPELEQAIYAGVALSLILYLKDSGVAGVKTLAPVRVSDGRFVEQTINGENPSISIFQLEGNLYFGSASDLEKKLSDNYSDAKVFLIRFKGISVIDITALEVIESFINRAQSDGKRVMLSGVSPKIYRMLEKMHIIDHVGSNNVFMEEDEVFATSGKVLDEASSFVRNIGYSTQERTVRA